MLSIGYFIIVAAGEFFDRWDSTEERIDKTVFTRTVHVPVMTVFRLLAQNRWVWLGPTLSVLTLYLYVLLKPQVAATSPMLYRLF